MKRLTAWLGMLGRLQQQRMFKVIASCVILAAAVIACISYSVAVSAASSSMVPLSGTPTATATPSPAPPPEQGASGEAAKTGETAANMVAGAKPDLDATARIINDILSAKQSTAGFATMVGIASAICLTVIWLGLALTYLGLIVVGGLLVGLFVLIGRGKDLGIAAAGLIGLVAAFTALLTVSRLLFSGSTPVMAVAKNVLTEATRMKISVIFIVLVVFGLAALPLVLDPEQPLRYRVQSFLQYATAGSFWAIAILVLVFSVSSVATEQRDKVIWQTMTKPVAAWQYILGKWLGVCTLAAVLLLVCTSGIFLFSEYLRTQPATGESQAYVATSGRGITEDRLILETQVLTSRTTVRVAPIELDNETFRKNVQDKVETEMRTLEQTIGSPDELKRRREALRTAIADSLRNSINMEYHSIRPGTGQWYRFEGLAAAKTTNRPIILRFKLDSGSNRPDAAFKITLQFMGSDPQVMPIGLGQFHTLPINPQVIDENGNADLQIINADVRAGRPNPETLAFSPEGLEISYSSGGFRANFMRCALVLWIKLAFLAMLAICASTFLSFSIAALVSFAIFLAAEGAGFVSGALENYMTEDSEGKTLVLNTVVAHIAGVVATTFKIYADLRPTGRLVEGLELSLLDVASGAIVLAAATGVLYMIAVYVFRRRELAIYSGN